ncbi:MAG: hemolysin D [Pirellulaceae bacterium]|nr:MAG: hemolysin D [Pirellulaceae bacterium]
MNRAMKRLPKKLLFGAIIPLALVIAGVGFFLGMKAPPPPKSALPRPVPEELLPYVPRVDVAMVRALSEVSPTLDLHAHGTVVPYRELEIGAQVAGKIIEKPPELRSGNYVQQGQLLYRIDPRDYQLDVERLTQRLEQEAASLRELDQDIANAQDLLQVAEQELQLANADVERLESLNANFSSAAELDQARRARLAALNQVVSLKNQLRTLDARRARMQLNLKLAETELEQAKLNLERTVVRAPVDGRIVSEQVEVDSFVQRGTPLVVLEDTSKAEIACNLRMDQLLWILDQQINSAEELVSAAHAARFELPETAAVIEFRVGGREEQVMQWEAVVDRFDGAGLDPQSRTVPIRLRVDQPYQVHDGLGKRLEMTGPPVLVRGMFVDVIIKTQPGKQLLLVPKLSIKPSNDDYVIWKFAPDDRAVFQTPIAKLAAAAGSSDAETPGEQMDAATAERAGRQNVDPSQWQAGFLKVIEDVNVVSELRNSELADGYWVCEVDASALRPGDFVITSPIPGIKADGTDPVRTPKAKLQPRPLGPIATVPDGQRAGGES